MDPREWLRRMDEKRLKDRMRLSYLDVESQKAREQMDFYRGKMILERQRLEWEANIQHESIAQSEEMARLAAISKASQEAIERRKIERQDRESHDYLTGLEEAQNLIDSLNQKVA